MGALGATYSRFGLYMIRQRRCHYYVVTGSPAARTLEDQDLSQRRQDNARPGLYRESSINTEPNRVSQRSQDERRADC